MKYCHCKKPLEKFDGNSQLMCAKCDRLIHVYCKCERAEIAIKDDIRICLECGLTWDPEHGSKEETPTPQLGIPAIVRKKIPPLVVAEQLNQAKRDLIQYDKMFTILTTIPVKFSEADWGFFNRRWPVKKEEVQSGFYIQKWRDHMVGMIDYIKQYILETEQWLQNMKDKPFRCSLPKKKQRELGMLPPV